MQIEDVNKHGIWTEATVDALISLRELAIKHGTRPLKAWQMLAERVQLAIRRATTVDEWLSKIMEEFRVANVDLETSERFVDLVGAVGPDYQEWHSMVESSLPMLLARARLKWERTKKARRAEREHIEESVGSASEVLASVGATPRRGSTRKAKTKPAPAPASGQGELL